MRILVGLLCVTMALPSVASPIQVGNTSIETPSPPGFARAEPEMADLLALQKSLTPPSNESLALFISESDVPMALAGQQPPLKRRFTIQMLKQLSSMRPLTQADFAGLKRSIREDAEKNARDVLQKLPGLLTEASKDISQQFDIDFMMKVGDAVPLPVHHEDRNSISSSMINRYEYDFGGGEKMEEVVAATNTILLVNGRVLFLYAYGQRDDLEWTREASKAWVQAILEANTKSNTSALTGAHSGSSDIWDGVGNKAASGLITGLFFGGIAALVGLVKRRKKRES